MATRTRPGVRLIIAAAMALAGGCTTHEPLATVPQLDLDRYMGTWYVIGHIPPFLTKDAFNAVETYSRNGDHRVDVLFTYNKGAFGGPAKILTPTAFTDVGTLSSEWGMRFVWPLKSDFRITHVDADYAFTIVARNRRDYVWIMAREPIIADADYQDLLRRVAEQGYDSGKVRKVPQLPRAQRDDSAHEGYP